MKTKTYHSSNLGSAANIVRAVADVHGYVTIHDDPKYDTLTEAEVDAQLLAVADDTSREADLITAALLTQRAELAIRAWRARQ